MATIVRPISLILEAHFKTAQLRTTLHRDSGAADTVLGAEQNYIDALSAPATRIFNIWTYTFRNKPASQFTKLNASVSTQAEGAHLVMVRRETTRFQSSRLLRHPPTILGVA